jgi:hypothetical protein
MRRGLTGLLVLLAAGCGGSPPLSGPTFNVRVGLSTAAKAKLAMLGERIRVVAYFDGDSWRRPLYSGGPFRAVFLGKQDVEIGLDDIAHFQGTRFPDNKVTELLWGRYFVTINLFSARIGSSDNLLNCPAPKRASSKLADQTIDVDCKLIRSE